MFTCFFTTVYTYILQLSMFIHETIYTICRANQNGVTLKKKDVEFWI